MNTIQLFADYFSKEPQALQPEQIVELIQHDNLLKSSTLSHRDLLAQGQAEAAKEVKKLTPQIAVSFRMEGGKDKANCRDCLHMVMIDFDAKKPSERLPDDELQRVFSILRTSYHALIGYTSLSGLGYHIIVPYQLPEGIVIDMQNDAARSEQIYKRAYHFIAHYYSACCGHPMDMGCDNINRMAGLSHDPQAVWRSDVRPICLTRHDLGIDADGQLIVQRTPRKAVGLSGQKVALPVGDSIEQGAKLLEQGGITFEPCHHDFIMRLSFILNRMGIDEEQAAEALEQHYGAHMHHRPSKVLHSCYKSAADEFGMWMQKLSKSAIKTQLIADFLSKQSLRHDMLTQKTLQQDAQGQWTEVGDRRENDLFLACCTATDMNLSQPLFHTVLNSNVVPEVNPLQQYVEQCPPWTPDMPDYLLQVARQVHMSSQQEDKLWQQCFPKWFVAMVASWLREDVVNHQIIVLVGRQGIYKSTWVRSLLPPELKTYVCDMPDVSNFDKDEELRTAEFGLINLDEIDKLGDRELNKLKAILTATNVNVRASYGRHKERRVRVASYAASGNKTEFLTDLTGNRRWLPFHVDHIDSPFTTTLPYHGMYGQALYLLQHGFTYWFSETDTSTMSGHIEQFMVPSTEKELIQVYFSPAQRNSTGAKFLTLAEIGTKLTTYGMLRKNIEPRRLGAILSKLGFQQMRSGKNGTRGYLVVEHTQADIERLRSPAATQADMADMADIIF